jgi:hypothetical protein
VQIIEAFLVEAFMSDRSDDDYRIWIVNSDPIILTKYRSL